MRAVAARSSSGTGGDRRIGGGDGRIRRYRRAPGEQPPLQLADQALGGERQDRDDQHRGEHAVRIEVVLRGGDDQPEAFLRAEELADDRADDGEPESHVQARDDPGERGRQHDVTDDLEPGGAEHARAGDEVAVDFPDALEGVEEDDEEDQNGGQHDLGGRAQAQPDDEDRAQHDARQRVHGLDVGPEDVGEEPDLPQQDPEDNAAGHAHGKAQECFLHRDPYLQPQRAVFGSVLRPVDELVPDAGGLAEEERIDDLPGREQLPAAEQEHEGAG